MRRFRFAISATAAILATPLPAQDRPTSPPTDLLRQVQALGLPSATDRLTVYYDPGHEAKAVRLRSLLQDAAAFYRDSLGVTLNLSIAVLERHTWDRLITWQPYGIPGVEGAPAVAFLPATDDNLAADDARSLESEVSDSAKGLVAEAGHDWSSASRRYVDYVGLHELGHALVQAYGIQVRSMWLHEWLATYVGYTYLRAARPADARLWEGVLHGYRDAVRPAHRTLEAFDRLYFGVGARNYVWYQARFQQRVQAVHDTQGVAFLRRLKASFPAGHPPVTSREVLLQRLETLSPGFLAWADGMR